MRISAAAPAGVLLAGAWAMAGAAEPVVYAFAGKVTELVVDGGLFGPPATVAVGDVFTGQFAYEVGPANADQEPADPQLGRYDLLAFAVDQSAPPLSTTLFGVGVVHEPGLPTLPPLPPDPGLDRLTIIATADVYPTVTLALSGPFGSAFADDSLPAELELADFSDGGFVRGLVAIGLGGNPDVQDRGVLTSLTRVPEPGVTPLAVAAGLTLGLLRIAEARWPASRGALSRAPTLAASRAGSRRLRSAAATGRARGRG